MTIVSKGLIVGGGIAGLSSAIALQQAGVQCDVAEIGDLRPVGAGIGLAGRAPDALDELGVYDQVVATGQLGLGRPVMYDAAGGVLSAAPPPDDIPGAREPIGGYRPALAEILVKRATELGARVETGMSIESIVDTADATVVTMTDGEVRSYDFVIGADGINSRTRSLAFPDAPEVRYAGQMSIRWVFPSDPVDGEGWYISGEMGRMAFYHQPYPNAMYCPMVLNLPRTKMSQQEAYEFVKRFLDTYTAPAIVELRKHLTPESELIVRPFDWMLMGKPWHRGRTLLIGDAAHATTAHMGMGGGMALEDGVVLAQCVTTAASLEEAYETFFDRRFERVKTVVETSVTLSEREQQNLPPGPENGRLMGRAMGVLAQPY
ncbi:FAD-dependent monooxygenase [Streptomyces sp. NPDC058464]|uniref:FAD-dependent monooxygenase n=1 Tax=Streptomyces sp. NPDC058464 TaxID=3346511 RepID=UPI003662959D